MYVIKARDNPKSQYGNLKSQRSLRMSILGEGSSSSEMSRTPAPGQLTPFVSHVSHLVPDYATLERIVTRKSRKFRENPNRGEDSHAYYANLGDSDVYLILWPKDGILGPKRLEIEHNGQSVKPPRFGMPVLIRLDKMSPFMARIDPRTQNLAYDPRTRKPDYDPNTEIFGTLLHPKTRIPMHRKNLVSLTSRYPEFPSEFKLLIANPDLDPDPEKRLVNTEFVEIRNTYKIYAYVTTIPRDVEFLEPIVENMAAIYKYYENTHLFFPHLLHVQMASDKARALYRGIGSTEEDQELARDADFKLQGAVARYNQEIERTREYKIPAALLVKYT
jgi:hypothetical protein